MSAQSIQGILTSASDVGLDDIDDPVEFVPSRPGDAHMQALSPEERRAIWSEKNKRRYEERKARGQCVSAPKHDRPINGNLRCEACRKADAERAQVRKNKRSS